ncbi:MAG: tRNA uridine-5-carboxymethylaminomethyl(34) synthesis enzyme MnmG [Paludibacteraceae bacterium]|nr:tRNA uridine-5-carboxymethylaminomethyl(34) synthesis enzyme MnmG [Paludibacteraceae bacterium]
MRMTYDVVVVGGGHAGCEAAAAAANMGEKTLLVTMDMNKIAQMSCNPAVGGIAKGQIVREIDALGGLMGIVTDESAIQFRLLNRSKGPAMWSPRSQCDREKFIMNWRRKLESIENLEIWQDSAVEIILKEENGKKKARGIKTKMGVEIEAKSVILTCGTFLDGLMHIGKIQMKGGRVSEPASYGLTEQLKEEGFSVGRMKTGTPVRLDGKTIDFKKMKRQTAEDMKTEETSGVERKGNDYFEDTDWHRFSYLPTNGRKLKQRSCWITYTNERTHEILREGLPDSPLYNGQIKSIGPRYCPSIETKIVTFADKDKHQLFVEPESEEGEEYYLNGFSSSLPMEVQFEALHSIEGLENVVAYRPGYAIEYDYFDPTQLEHTLETKKIENLFFAGQINGTTGYEEAAGQGLLAGINAALKAKGKEKKFTLGRDESYIGVLIDDLVTKGVDEPYRMFTSRAEYRILLRQDDADMRLTEKSHEIGLADDERFALMKRKKENRDKLLKYMSETTLHKEEANEVLKKINKETAGVKEGVKIIDLLKRPEVNLKKLTELLPELNEIIHSFEDRNEEIAEAAEILVKYEGYIKREKALAEKENRLDNIKIKGKIDYKNIKSLSTEARQKLEKINPETIGQASRIPGVSPADISILIILAGR